MQEEKVMSNHERFHCEGEESDLEHVGQKTSLFDVKTISEQKRGLQLIQI